MRFNPATYPKWCDNLLRKFLDLLSPAERKRAGLLLVMILVMALLDMIGVASIMPFMAVLANPELVETNAFLSPAFRVSEQVGVTTVEQFLFLLGICVFVLLVASLAFKALTTYAQARFTRMREYSIGERLVEGYLRQPYSWFLNRHSADLGKTILSEIGTVISQGVAPIMNLIAHGAVALALLALLILVDPQLTVIISFTLAGAYALVFLATRGLLERIGRERVIANQERFTAVSEAFGASKEVKVGGLESIFVQRFAEPAQTFAKHQATASVISQLPRFAIEAIAFGGMLLVVLYLMAQSGSFESALPIVALYAFAGYRLMPALQQIYAALTQLRFVGAALNSLHADLMSLKPAHANESSEIIQFQNAITLNNVTYRYPSAKTAALSSVNLSIPVRSTIGLVGSTGSGKTTTVDLILGLLEAQEGALEVDGKPITEHNKRAWQRAIGYVPQHIYLADDTVAANIAFGLEVKDIDQTAVERAAKIANLHEFVVNNLPKGYSTTLGERGVRLSGGQRQRIGIARALYHNPQVIILDEATSALDSLTEQAVMEAVNNLAQDVTIIVIAHRLSTVRKCDQIYLLERGEVRASGTYDELNAGSQQFAAMARGI